MTYSKIVDDLMALGLVDASRIVGDGFSFVDVSRRNQNLRMEFGSGSAGYFIKIGVEPSKCLTIANEAYIYRALRELLSRGSAATLPEVHGFNPVRSMLVLQMLDSSTVGSVYASRPHFAAGYTAMLGRALGRIHRELSACRTNLGVEAFCPVTFEFLNPSMAFLETCSWGCLEFLKALQRSEHLCVSLADLEIRWRKLGEATPQLIHGDVRLDNCCLAPSRRSIRIVDWELAGTGDPNWDVGSVFADLLSGWLLSVPPCSGADPTTHAHLASTPLALVKESARAFWGAYVKSRGWTCEARMDALTACTRYAAVRLVQLAFEHLKASSWTTPYAIAHLQVCDNLLDRPVDGAALLLGLAA